MEQRCRPVHRLLQLKRLRAADCESGAYTIEGIVAIGVFFTLIALVVHMGFLILARGAAATSVEASLAGAVAADLGIDAAGTRIVRDVRAVVPGAQNVVVQMHGDAHTLRARVEFRWVPPGPDLIPLTVVIERSHAKVVPP